MCIPANCVWNDQPKISSALLVVSATGTCIHTRDIAPPPPPVVSH